MRARGPGAPPCPGSAQDGERNILGRLRAGATGSGARLRREYQSGGSRRQTRATGEPEALPQFAPLSVNGSDLPIHDAQIWYADPGGLSGPEGLGMIMPKEAPSGADNTFLPKLP